MAASALQLLHDHGQSVWLDYIRRDFITSGELARGIERDGLRGITSNPNIFEAAIAKSDVYDSALEVLVASGADAETTYERLAIEDIQLATDVLRTVFDASGGRDGFVSLEVAPNLAHDTEQTVHEAHRLFAAVDRPNVMIKVPGTPAGVVAVERLLTDGLNINITLIFAEATYEAVANAYIRALEARVARGESIDQIASVASVFVSRIDTAIDKELEKLIAAGGPQASDFAMLRGRAGIANAKAIYRRFREMFDSDRFATLKERGAAPQRPLWASTSTKNPEYRDVMYVEELIGPSTINTMNAGTMDAFRDHGEILPDAIEVELPDWLGVIPRLREAGIDVDAVLHDVQVQGIRLFRDAHDGLLANVRAKRARLIGVSGEGQVAEFGGSTPLVVAAVEEARAAKLAERMWSREVGLWSGDAQVRDVIAHRLGWLRIAETMRAEAAELAAWGAEAARDVSDVVLLGMGGSSLAPEVLQAVLGSVPGHPRLTVLDSTSPETVRRVGNGIDVRRTLFLVASKSGTTLETSTLFEYFWGKVLAGGVAEPGRQFVAITDPGTILESLGKQRAFARIFSNAPDIGGRYSALSYFGLVPAALMGVDLVGLLDRAIAFGERSRAQESVRDNPAIALGVALGALARAGRDKLTIVASPTLDPLGAWIEQLVAESTGKEGLGILPVHGEPLGVPDVYGKDRVFVEIALEAEADPVRAQRLSALESAGHPVVRILVADRLDLGAEFLRWELATAAAGWVLGVNPFDEPNVGESKANTAQVLARIRADGRMPPDSEGPADEGVRVIGASEATPEEALRVRLRELDPNDYIAIHAYLDMTPAAVETLRRAQAVLRDFAQRAVTVGFGPRFLHSTGQFHKGGPNRGLFIQVLAQHPSDLPTADGQLTFGTLIEAQALGDWHSFEAKQRPTIRIRLDEPSDLDAFVRLVERTVQKVPAVQRRARPSKARGT